MHYEIHFSRAILQDTSAYLKDIGKSKCLTKIWIYPVEWKLGKRTALPILEFTPLDYFETLLQVLKRVYLANLKVELCQCVPGI